MSFLELELNLFLRKKIKKNNMNNNWRHKYFEKSKNELHTNIFRSLEIEQYLKQILKNNSFNLHDLKLNFSNLVINIYLSVHRIEPNLPVLKKKLLVDKGKISSQKSKRIKVKNQYLRKKFSKTLPNKLNYFKTLYYYKKYIVTVEKTASSNVYSLAKKILESLNLFTNNKYNINLTIQEINFINSISNSEQMLLSFRKFERTPFFKESKSLLIPLLRKKNSAKLLSSFIAFQLESIKRHNFFFNFLQESLTLLICQKSLKIEGTKIIISGRLNNAARARNKVIKVGKISLLKIKSNICYSKSTAFTSNGTFGVKVWISEKT